MIETLIGYPPLILIFNANQGVQFICEVHLRLLLNCVLRISMGSRGEVAEKL